MLVVRTESKLNNKYRVLLTEVLPYELPLVLNNEAFYKNMQNESLRKTFFDVFNGIVKSGTWTISFDYDIRRIGGERSRKLSLMHPMTQLDCVEHYAKYDDYMIPLCSRSPFSIRHIVKKAKFIFPFVEVEEKTVSEDELERPVEVEEDEVDIRYRSYFKYEKYDLVYKFFESGDNLRLEQKYSHMLKIDVSGCFYHIYTHSVTWAVKGKDIAKKNTKAKTFENDFDNLMQHANYNETNGIIVGPEISRIFAEIILQAVDLAILRELKEQYGYSLGRDYEIRRYVDDSFVYATSQKILENVCLAYQDQLAYYKLDINKSKLEYRVRPFTTAISDAKLQLNRMVTEFKERYLQVDEDGNYKNGIRKEMSVFTLFVKQFRSITNQNKQTYGDLNKYVLTILLRQIRAEIKAERIPSLGLLTTYVEISYYIFSLDMHTTASYRLCSILECLVRWAERNNDKTIGSELGNRIRREAKRVLDIYKAEKCEFNTNMEALNLLIALNRLINYKPTMGQIEALFGINCDKEESYGTLNYFQICTLLYIIEKDEPYQAVRKNIEDEAIKRISCPQDLKKSENAYLFFDMMTCPYVDKCVGMKMVKKACNIGENKAYEKRKKLGKPLRWFFDWDKGHALEYFLSKKEYHSPYE